MESRPLVTVALPYYNAPRRYVAAAIESLFAQDVAGWTGFLLDDSPGGNASIQALVGNYRDARLSYKQNSDEHGIGSAWNACLDAASTDLVCLLHTDDELSGDYLSTMLSLANRNPDASIYFCDATVIDTEGSPCFSLPDRIKNLISPKGDPMILHGKKAVARVTIANFIFCPTMMYRKSKLGTQRFSKQYNFVLDYRLILDTLFAEESIVGTHKRAYRYRRHVDQWTSKVSASGERFREELEILESVKREAQLRKWTSVFRLAQSRPVFRLNVAFELLRDFAGRQPFRAEKANYFWR